MKFQQLGIGQEFVYQGERYVKDGPVMARHCETGKKSLIPRSAPLQSAGEATPQSAATPPALSLKPEVLLDALNAYEYEIKMGLNTLYPGDTEPKLNALLQQARDKLLRGLQL